MKRRGWREKTGLGLALWAGLSLWGVQAEAEAWAPIEAEAVRSWPMPAGISPYTARIDGSVDGVTVLVTGRGAGNGEECVVLVSDRERSRAYSYRHDFYPTRCLDGAADGEGGVFLRGERADLEPEEVNGFTVRISAEGEVLWSLEDRELLEVFEGEYARALPELAYDPLSDRLMAMSLGRGAAALGGPPITQVHLIRGEDGELIAGGQTFGARSVNQIVTLLARDGEFLVHGLDGNDSEPRFYRVDEDQRVGRIEPGGEDWKRRRLLGPISFDGERGTYFLSRQESGGRPKVLFLDADQEVVWNREYPGEEELTPEGTPIGEAERLWVGRDLLAVEHRNQQRQEHFRFLDPETGEDLGGVKKRGLLSEDILGMVRNEEGGLRLIGFDPERTRFVEADLFWRDSEEVGEEEGYDQGEDGEEGGCAQVGGNGKSPMGAIILLVGGWFFLARARRRAAPAAIAKGGEQI